MYDAIAIACPGLFAWAAWVLGCVPWGACGIFPDAILCNSSIPPAPDAAPIIIAVKAACCA